jgi:uncharacterized protein YaaW (UPF0174 family)
VNQLENTEKRCSPSPAREERLYHAASVYCLKIQNIIDHLSELGANEQLKLLAGRLQRLSFRSTPLGADDTWSLSPIRGPRAYEVHGLPDDADFIPHATAIANEILWWGSNDFHRLLGEERSWREVLVRTAANMNVSTDQRTDSLPAWKVEGAILQKALDDWECMTPEQREEALRKAGWDLGTLKGGAMAVVGLSSRQLLAFLATRGPGYALAGTFGTFLAPLAAALGIGLTAYDVAGPSYRVLRPAVLTIACTRRRLRDERSAAAFRD